ncbi:MAG TPA: hypothetical protein PK031_04025 [Pseudomonadales bacterium]|nr:hypothetical protein [Pseudomonadales bacterium]
MSVNAEKILSSRWWYLLPAIGIAAYLLSVVQLADNTPKLDDLNDVFGFFKQLALANTPLQKTSAFFYPNNEHITLVNHLIYYAQYCLLGEIRFYPLILIGHLIVIATGLLLAIAANHTRQPFYFAVVALAYINLHYWDSTFKAMTAISNQAVILFAIASLFSLLRWHHFLLAIVFALLATFSQGNGIIIWPLGLLALFLEPHWQTVRGRYIAIWVCCALLSLCIYYWAQHTLGTPSPVTAAMVFSLFQAQPTLPVFSVLAFLGSTALLPTQTYLAIAIGIGALLILLWTMRSTTRPDRLIMLIALFLLASAVIAGVSRGLAAGNITGVLESRYKMYSIALVMLVLTQIVKKPAQHALVAGVMLVIALCIHSSGYRNISAIRQQAQQFSESYQYWLEDGDLRRQTVYFPPMSDHFLFVAEHLRLFDFMQLAQFEAIMQPLPAESGHKCPQTPAPADHCPMTIQHHGNAIAIAIDVHQPALPANITLCDEQANTVMEFTIPVTVSLEKPASQQHWLIPEADIPAGNYRVLFQPDQQAACETHLIKKPRKVKTEMRTLFGGVSISGQP